ncbi:VRR-NUC domain protein [Gimesia alba]|uniref:VRR-NUC domain protein n=1 Tax=Gimesia alba TaxID=2527973 RepID=A0A517RB44_9PLAN|nr:VRR-NUC domain-containing protein [Gimesia alba]QDT41101.1 VRR-NUC domain protein [Gimesia alba]
MGLTPEGRVTKAIKDYLTTLQRAGLPIWSVKIAGGKFQQAGLPDWHITYRGQSLWVEVKKPGGKPTDLQTATIEKIQRAGGVSCVVTSVDEVKALLRKLDSQSG